MFGMNHGRLCMAPSENASPSVPLNGRPTMKSPKSQVLPDPRITLSCEMVTDQVSIVPQYVDIGALEKAPHKSVARYKGVLKRGIARPRVSSETVGSM